MTAYEYDKSIPTSEAMMGICGRNSQKVKIVTEQMSDFSNLCSTPSNANWYNVPCHILLTTYMFASLLQQSSGYLHKNADKIK